MTWFNILKKLDIPQKHSEAMQHEEERMDESIVDITTTNTTGSGDVGECCRQFVYDYFFNTPENPFESGPYTSSEGNQETFDPQEMYDFWTASQETCDHFIESIRQESGARADQISGSSSFSEHRRKILAEYDSCVGSDNIDSSGTFYRAWKSILKGGSLRLHFPSFKKAVLEWNETQQVGNEDRLDNMLKEIQPIYERNYFDVIGNQRRVTRNANKKVPMAKKTLSNILHNNGWIKKMKHNTKTIDEKWNYGYKPIGTMTESIGIYEKVK